MRSTPGRLEGHAAADAQSRPALRQLRILRREYGRSAVADFDTGRHRDSGRQLAARFIPRSSSSPTATSKRATRVCRTRSSSRTSATSRRASAQLPDHAALRAARRVRHLLRRLHDQRVPQLDQRRAVRAPRAADAQPARRRRASTSTASTRSRIRRANSSAAGADTQLDEARWLRPRLSDAAALLLELDDGEGSRLRAWVCAQLRRQSRAAICRAACASMPARPDRPNAWRAPRPIRRRASGRSSALDAGQRAGDGDSNYQRLGSRTAEALLGRAAVRRELRLGSRVQLSVPGERSGERIRCRATITARCRRSRSTSSTGTTSTNCRIGTRQARSASRRSGCSTR